jgi:hypothetical protein
MGVEEASGSSLLMSAMVVSGDVKSPAGTKDATDSELSAEPQS